MTPESYPTEERREIAEMFLGEGRHYDDVGRRLLFQIYTICFGTFAVLAASEPIFDAANGSLYLLAFPYGALGAYWIAMHLMGEFLTVSAQKHACHERALSTLARTATARTFFGPLAWFAGGGHVRYRSRSNWMLIGLFTAALVALTLLTHLSAWTSADETTDQWVIVSGVACVGLAVLTAFGWADTYKDYHRVIELLRPPADESHAVKGAP